MRLYFIGICGTAMGNVASLMKGLGHTVAGSDRGIYPPMSDVLAGADIEVYPGWNPENITSFRPDLVVVGNAVTRGNAEVEFLLEARPCRFTSLPALIDRQLLGSRMRIVVTGTHGKTTTTAITAWLLQEAGVQPGWLIGGVPGCLSSGTELGHSQSPFIIEGDEYDSAFFDKRSKFIHYWPDVLAINNLEFDHVDIFRDLADVKRTFQHLIRIVPSHGLILANGDDPALRELLPIDWAPTRFVGIGESCDYVIGDFTEGPAGSSFRLTGPAGFHREFSWKTTGLFNARNAAMAFLSAAHSLRGERRTVFLQNATLQGFQGVRRRQDVLWESEQVMVVEDFAHHPTAIAACIESFRNCYPESEITSVFEPRSNTSATNLLEAKFTDSLSLADSVLIAPIHRPEAYPKEKRIDPFQMAKCISQVGKRAAAYASKEHLFRDLADSVNGQPKVILLFTNGSFGQPLQDFLKGL